YLGDSVHLVEVTENADDARARLLHQQINLVVIAPADVEQNFRNGQQSTVEIEYNELDPVRDNYARFVAYRQIQELNRAIIEQAVSRGEQYVLQSTAGQQVMQVPPEVVAAPTRAEPVNLAPVRPNVVAFFAPAVLALVLQHMG